MIYLILFLLIPIYTLPVGMWIGWKWLQWYIWKKTLIHYEDYFELIRDLKTLKLK